MKFLMNLTFAMELIALGVGVGFIIWSRRHDGNGTTIANIFGYIITIAAILTLLCTGYSGVRAWKKGCQKCKKSSMMMNNQMMQNTT